jgi:hypothetical protein
MVAERFLDETSEAPALTGLNVVIDGRPDSVAHWLNYASVAMASFFSCRRPLQSRRKGKWVVDAHPPD